MPLPKEAEGKPDFEFEIEGEDEAGNIKSYPYDSEQDEDIEQ